MKELVLQTIWQLEQEREVARKEPKHPTSLELYSRIQGQVNKALEDLENEGRITTGPVLNGKYFKTNIS